MAASATLITDLLTDEGLDSNQVTGADNRAMALRIFQRVSNRLWGNWAWTHKVIYGTVTVTSGEGLLPTDFKNIGPRGTAHIGTGQPPLKWIPLRSWQHLKQTIGQTGTARYYSYGPTIKEHETGEGRRYLYLYPLDTTTVYLWYERNAPTLTDGTDADGMVEWPEAFAAALYEMAVWYRMKQKGNIQSQTEQAQYMQSLIKDLKVTEMAGRESSQRISPYPLRNIGP
jgi:hypothetical protein